MTAPTEELRKPVMIMAGGTGGHIFPALAIADYLHEKKVPLLWLGSEKGMENKIVPAAGYQLLNLKVGGLRGKGGLTLIMSPFRILYAVYQALIVMINHRPAAVLGMGGFASGPGGIAARLMRIPLVIHEQNAIAGITNRWLSRIASKAFEAFPGALPNARKVFHVGNPVRASIINLVRSEQTTDSFNLLVVGGSLGAVKLNETVPAAIAQLPEQLASRIRIWHQSGEKNFGEAVAGYREFDIEARVEPFLEQIDKAYAWADVVICRAGALTVSELAVAGLPAILVPYPYAVDDHQTANGRYLTDVGAAVLITDKDLQPELICRQLQSWIENTGLIKKMSQQARSVAMLNATQQVAEACYALAYGGER